MLASTRRIGRRRSEEINHGQVETRRACQAPEHESPSPRPEAVAIGAGPSRATRRLRRIQAVMFRRLIRPASMMRTGAAGNVAAPPRSRPREFPTLIRLAWVMPNAVPAADSGSARGAIGPHPR